MTGPIKKVALTALALLALVGCAPPEPRDYSAFRANMPRSVLVLPPANRSVEVNAPYSYVSTMTRPLAEAGYYVFPVAVIDAFMKENGLSSPREMHEVPLDRLHEIFGADAVLYVDIEDYGQSYHIVASSAVVNARATLVDIRTGATLWEGKASARDTQNNGSSDNIIGLLIGAALAQAVNVNSDISHSLSARANKRMIASEANGFLLGPYSPDHETDVRGRITGEVD